MKVKVEETGPCRRVLHVHAPVEATEPEYVKILEFFAERSRIPGFRRGKAPAKLVEKNYQKEILEEARDRLVPRLYRDAMTKEKLTPVSVIGVNDVVFEREKGITFNVMVDVAPEFKLPKYTRISLKTTPAEVSPEEEQEAMKQLLQNFTRFEDVTGRPVQKGDLVKIDYAGLIDGKSVKDMAADCSGLGEGKDFWAIMEAPEFLPGMVDGLVGAEMQSSRDIQISFPADYHVPAVAGKVATYTVAVTGIRERILPEMNEEFLKRFEVTSEADLRVKIRQDLQKAAEDKEKNRLKDEIAKYLLEKTKLDLPQSVVEEETNWTVRSIVQQNAMRGISREQMEKEKDGILGEATRVSAERVKLTYILSRIAGEEKIVVTDAEVDARVESMASRYRMSPAQFRAELEKRSGVDEVKNTLSHEKTLDFLLENAKVKK